MVKTGRETKSSETTKYKAEVRNGVSRTSGTVHEYRNF